MPTYPYEWYVYKDVGKDKCPECGSLPRDYFVPHGNPSVPPPVTFVCAFSHEWQAPENEWDKAYREKENGMTKYTHLENTYLHYGVCPLCGDSCQPDFVHLHNRDLEYAQCDECGIDWHIHHEDPTDKRDDTENWRTYRISDIEEL